MLIHPARRQALANQVLQLIEYIATVVNRRPLLAIAAAIRRCASLAAAMQDEEASECTAAHRFAAFR